MKSRTILMAILACAICVVSCNKENKGNHKAITSGDIKGFWELTQIKYMMGDKVVGKMNQQQLKEDDWEMLANVTECRFIYGGWARYEIHGDKADLFYALGNPELDYAKNSYLMLNNKGQLEMWEFTKNTETIDIVGPKSDFDRVFFLFNRTDAPTLTKENIQGAWRATEIDFLLDGELALMVSAQEAFINGFPIYDVQFGDKMKLIKNSAEYPYSIVDNTVVVDLSQDIDWKEVQSLTYSMGSQGLMMRLRSKVPQKWAAEDIEWDEYIAYCTLVQ